MLEQEDLVTVRRRLQEFPPKDVVNVLFSAICRETPHVRWVAISCMGETVARLAAEDIEAARIVMRRFLWSLNDESGGIGWGAPEALAESMYHHPQLAREYCHMLVSYMQEDGEELLQDGNFLELPGLQKGLLWGIDRLAGKYPDYLIDKINAADLAFFLSSVDPDTCALAARIAGRLNMLELEPRLQALKEDARVSLLYEDGVIHQVTVRQCVRDALERMHQYV